METKSVIIAGYSGHAFVAVDALMAQGYTIAGYVDVEEKAINPYRLKYLGSEQQLINHHITHHHMFVGIGDNYIRAKVFNTLSAMGFEFVNAIHPSSVVSPAALLGRNLLIAPLAVINANTKLEDGTICNTHAIIEHDCQLKKFVHIAPNATLCGNVEVNDFSFIGSGSTVIQGITIGSNVVVGANTLVRKNIENNVKVVGNPMKYL